MVVLVAPDHPWARRALVTREDLAAAVWVLRERGSGTRSTLEAAIAGAGVDCTSLSVAMTLPSNEAVLAAAEAGAGATALSESVARASLAEGRLVRAPFELPARNFHLLRHRARYRSRAGDAFVAMLE
jgi:DNA-binding transcriptional LysR family regulator